MSCEFRTLIDCMRHCFRDLDLHDFLWSFSFLVYEIGCKCYIIIRDAMVSGSQQLQNCGFNPSVHYEETDNNFCNSFPSVPNFTPKTALVGCLVLVLIIGDAGKSCVNCCMSVSKPLMPYITNPYKQDDCHVFNMHFKYAN